MHFLQTQGAWRALTHMEAYFWMQGLRNVVKDAPRGLSRSLKGIAADLVARSTAMCCLPLVQAWPPRTS